MTFSGFLIFCGVYAMATFSPGRRSRPSSPAPLQWA